MPHYSDTSRAAQFKGYVREPQDVQLSRAGLILREYTRGVPYDELARRHRMTKDGIRCVLRDQLRSLRCAYRKWKLAEARLKVVTMQLRYALLSKEYTEDPPLDVLDPPPRWKAALEGAGVKTVGKLRAVDGDVLLMMLHFPTRALEWAILALDERGLSHHLRMRKNRKTH